MLLALFETPEPLADADLRAASASLALTLADVRLRLAGPRPRIVLQDHDQARVVDAEAALRRLGWQVQAFDTTAVPGDADRVIARRLEPDDANGVVRVWDQYANCHVIAPRDVLLLQRALRSRTVETQVKSHDRQFAPVRAIVSGGLLLTKKVERTTTHTTEKQESMLVLHRRDAEDIVFYERELDYRFLGSALQPASQANFVALSRLMRTWFPKTPFDERALRPLALGLQSHGRVDPTDLALFLVALAHVLAGRAG